MRTAFIKTLTTIARKDKNVILVTGDLGFTVFENFKKEFPDQFINIGVSEQNMMSFAAGLALSGKKVYVYSIAPFATLRCYEQIRNDICFHDANVTIIGVGGGFSYGIMGPSHHALEDISIMKVLPSMRVICPGDPLETEAVLFALLNEKKGPSYVRLGKRGEKNIHSQGPPLQIGKALSLRHGTDLSILTTGNMLETAVEVAERLAKDKIYARVLSIHTVKPIDTDSVISAARETKAVFTLEEHYLDGGFGSSVAEILSENKMGCTFKRFAVENKAFKMCGTQNYLRELNGLTVPQIEQKIKECLP